MRKWFLLILALSFLLVPMHARAQEDMHFDSVLVHLWPEFDRPEMLVMLEINVAESVSLPQDIELQIPAQADITRVAVGETQESVSTQGVEFEVSAEGEWQHLTIHRVGGRAVRVEYYDALTFAGIQRQYVFQWTAITASGRLRVDFQQPIDASRVELEPSATTSSMDANRLIYHHVILPTPMLGESLTLTIQYQKYTSRLSATHMAVQPLTSLGSEAQGRISFAGYMTWLVGLVGFLLIVIGLGIGMSYLRGGGKSIILHWRYGAAALEKENPIRALNCPECGFRMQPGDQFCRACGRQMKTEK